MNWFAVIFLALAIGAHGVPDAELEAEEARQQTTTTTEEITTIGSTTVGSTPSTPQTTTTTIGSTTVGSTPSTPQTTTTTIGSTTVGSTPSTPQTTTTTIGSTTVGSTLTSTPETTTTGSTSTIESSTQTSTTRVSTTVGTASTSTEISTTIGSNVTTVTSIPNTTLPPGNLDQQCRNRFRFFSNLGANVSFNNINSEYPCRVYCRIRAFFFNFVRYFNLQDMASCGDNRVCRVGSCLQALSQDEINRCQERYPGRNVTALPGTTFNQCRITCYPTRNARFFIRSRTVYRTDGVSCQYERLFGLFNGAGQCRNGRCQRVRRFS